MNQEEIFNKIALAIEKSINNNPNDFLLCSKQENYLSYLISKELTDNLINQYCPTQFKKSDITIINSTGSIDAIFESKFHYSSDFMKGVDWGEKTTIGAINQLNNYKKTHASTKINLFLIQFVVHFSENNITSIYDNINNKKPPLFLDKKYNYFAYLNNGRKKYYNPSIKFKNTNKKIFINEYPKNHIEEIKNILDRENIKLNANFHKSFEVECNLNIMNCLFNFNHSLELFIFQI